MQRGIRGAGMIVGVLGAVALALPTGAAQSGGLAVPVAPGKIVLSASLGYGDRDVRNGGKDEVTTRRLLFRLQTGLTEGVEGYLFGGFSDADFDRGGFTGTLGGAVGAGLKYGLVHDPESGTRVILDLQGEFFQSRDGGDTVRQQTYHLAGYILKEMGAAGRVGYLYPYAGLQLSYARFSGADDGKSDDLFGVLAGADYFVNPDVFFSGEVHLFDENSLTLGVGYRF